MQDDTVSVCSDGIDGTWDATSNLSSDRAQAWLNSPGDLLDFASIAPAINRFREYCDQSFPSTQLLKILGDRSVASNRTVHIPGITTATSELHISFCKEESYQNACCGVLCADPHDHPDDGAHPAQTTQIRTNVSGPNSQPKTTIAFDPRRVHGANFLVWLAMYRVYQHQKICDFVIYEQDLLKGISITDLVVALVILHCHIGISASVTVVVSPRLTPSKWSLRYSLRSVVRRIADRGCMDGFNLSHLTGTGGVDRNRGSDITLKDFIDRMYWMAFACRGITGQKTQFDLSNATEQKGYVEFVRPYNKYVAPHSGATEEESNVLAGDKKRLEGMIQCP